MDALHRTSLLLGADAVAKLRGATVMIVGCGAVGSFAAEALARTGVGHIILIDSDVIEESNINRQLFALQSTLGLPKVDVAAARIHDINPNIRVTPMKLFFDNTTVLDLLILCRQKSRCTNGAPCDVRRLYPVWGPHENLTPHKLKSQKYQKRPFAHWPQKFENWCAQNNCPIFMWCIRLNPLRRFRNLMARAFLVR